MCNVIHLPAIKYDPFYLGLNQSAFCCRLLFVFEVQIIDHYQMLQGYVFWDLHDFGIYNVSCSYKNIFQSVDANDIRKNISEFL